VRRGDLITVVIAGDYGKPRPALVIQADVFEAIGSVTIAPLTSTLLDAPLIRVGVEPSPANGLRAASQVMADKLMTVPRDRAGAVFGRLEPAAMAQVEMAVRRFLGLA
jgi:mRNA interferase MazF